MATSTGWFFGDSFTFGYQCHPGNPYYEKSKYKDKRIVSQIVCDTLKLKHKNLAQYGHSNEGILHSVLTNVSSIKENDYVFIIDTHSTRAPIVYKHMDYYVRWPKGSYIEVKKTWDYEAMWSARENIAEKLNDFYKDIFNGLIKELSLRNVNGLYIPTNNTFLYERKPELVWQDVPEVQDGHWSFKGHSKIASIILNKIKGDKGLI